jgi:hypothetical protein
MKTIDPPGPNSASSSESRGNAMKDKLVKFHRKANYYRTRKVAVFAMAFMLMTASVAVPLSLMSVEAQQQSSTSQTTETESSSETM